MSAYNTMIQNDATNALAACFEIDSLRKEFYDRIIIKLKKNNTYRFIIEYSENKFETSSKFIGSPTHAIDNLIFYNTKAEAVTNYIEYTATYDDNTCYLDSSNAPSKKRFVANAFRLHAVNSDGYNTLYVSEFYPVMYSVADVFYGRQINLSEGMTIATAKSKENVINISKDGFRMWGYAGNLHANIGLQDDGSYGAWFPQIRIGGSSWSVAPFKTNSDGTVSISASQSAFSAYVLNKGVISVEQTNPNAQTVSCFYGETISNARLIRGIITNNDASSHDLIGSEYIFKQTKNFNAYYGMKLINYPDNTNYPNDYLETIYHQWGVYFGTAGTYAYNLWADKWFTIEKRTWVKGDLFVENGDISASNGIISTNKSITAGENIRAAGWIGIDGTDCQKGISLYNLGGGDTQYAIRFSLTGELGTHGAITAGYATYFTMKNWGGGARGWIFKSAENGNVASIADNGVLSIQGYLDVYSGSTIQVRLGNDGHIGCNSFIDAGSYIKCNGIDINNNSNALGVNRIWLYGNHTYKSYIVACETSVEGTHGYVTSDWATYFGMSNDTDNYSRGWIFKRTYSSPKGVFSIDCYGNTHADASIRAGSWILANARNIGNDCGLSLWGDCFDSNNFPRFGMAFRLTSNGGTHGYTNGDYATYITMGNEAGRGWIFRDTMTPLNVASISNKGDMVLRGVMKCASICSTPSSGIGTVNRYTNVCDLSFNALVGTAVIQLPVGWTSLMLSVEIDIYEYNGDGASKIIIGGYNYQGTSWYNTSVKIVGSYNKSVRLAYNNNTGKVCILLGNTNVAWAITIMSVNVMQGWGASGDLLTGWSSWTTTDESMFAYINTPSRNINIYDNIVCGSSLGIYLNNNSTIRQTNTTWGATLQIGYDINTSPNIASNAFIGCSNGNLHFDCKQGDFQTYINYYSKGAIFLQNTAEGGGITVNDGGMYLSNTFDFTGATNKAGDQNMKVGSIKGKFANELIHLYRRVNIGSPSGWGSMDAPEYGLSTYGRTLVGAQDVSAYLEINRYQSNEKYAYVSTANVADCGMKLQVQSSDTSWKIPLILQSSGEIWVNYQKLIVYKNAPSTNAYYNSAIEIRTDDASCAILGFHRVYNSAMSLYHAGYGMNQLLRICSNGGGDYSVLHEGYANAPIIGSSGNNSGGVSFYASPDMSYGVSLRTTASLGTHGSTTTAWAAYFFCNNDAGWIFRNNSTGNVASISNTGDMTLNGSLTLGSSSASSISPFWVAKKVGATVGLFGQTDQCPVMMYQYSADYTGMAFNAYHNGSSWYNITGSKSTFLIQHEPLNGALAFYGAPAVAAGNVPQWVKAFSIGTDGTTTFTKAPAMSLATAWTALSAYSGNWSTAPDSTFYSMGYCKSATNMVKLRGVAKNVSGTTLGTGTIIAQLPSGYRPAKTMIYMIPYSTYTTWSDGAGISGAIAVSIKSDGCILISNGLYNNYTLWFDSIEFSVD